MIFNDCAGERARIEGAIKKYGYAPEHNFDWYQYSCDEGNKNIFFETDDGALLTMQDKDPREFYVFSSPVAREARRVPILLEYLKYIFNEPGTKKVWLELETPVRKEFLQALPPEFRATAINYTLTWPIMDMRTFDPTLPGGHYKTIRKEKHKFYRDHKVEVVDAKPFEDKKELHRVVDDWKAKRGAHDKAYIDMYHHLIDGSFGGTSEARVFMVDGRAAGFNAGWMIPNSERFYGAVGVHDYSVEDLGQMLYLEDLEWLKQHNYGEVDMAGGEKALTAFKDKFQPAFYYRTFIFSVVKK